MKDLITTYQTYVLIACGFCCILLARCVHLIAFHSVRIKKTLLKTELCVGALLISDGLSYVVRGNTGTVGLVIARVSNFLVFFLTLEVIYLLDEYVTSIFMETGKFKKLPVRLLAGYIIISVGMTFLLISQFTGIYYCFDDNNVYSRGPLYFVSYLAPFASLTLIFSFVIQYRKMVNRRLFATVLMICSLPYAAAVVQFFFYGLSLTNFVAFLAAVTLFCVALSDQNKELSNAANTEVATGLPNTYGFLYEVEKVINYQDITAYNGYYFDIVRMGAVNNKYGKELGDEIILRYSKYIREAIDKDEILGRLGGNYFVALIKKSNTEKFLNLLQDVPVDIEFNGKTDNLHLAAIAGGYEVKKKNIAAGQILGNTSAALNYAKGVAHKPYAFLDEELEERFRKNRETEENARKGLESNEFEPFYQPKVNADSYLLCGAEALARWRRDGELVPPAEFIPLMEKNSSVCELDFYILERTCSDIKEWMEQGLDPVTVSVNFSRRNLGNPNLAENIYEVIKRYDIPTDLIQIEVTETLDEYPMSCLTDLVNALHERGIKAAIDDFGTGSSSIKLLKDVNFDVLKIDRSFMEYKDYRGKKLLQNIIQMAKDSEISVVAEGVEEISQVAELREMGCSVIQGFVFDRPVDKTEFEKRLRSKQYL